MNSVFIDTAPLGSLNNPDDQHQHETHIILERVIREHTLIITTDYVIDETTTLLISRMKGKGYILAKNLLTWIFKADSPIKVEWIGENRFHAAKTTFIRYNKDKQWSFTDCASFVVMKELKIKTAFTFDEHFTQMGFKRLGKD